MTHTIDGTNAMIDLIDESVLITGAGETISGWNRGAQDLYGWTPEEAIGRTVPDLLKCETEQPRSIILATVRERGHWSGRATRRTREGNELLTSVSWKARRLAGGQAVEFYETSRNLTDQHELTKRLEVAQHLATALFHTGSSSFWRLDFSRVLSMVNAIRAGGVRDLRSYLANNLPVVEEMMKVVALVDVNDRTLVWMGMDRERLLNGRLGQLWPADARQFFADCVVGLVEGAQEAAAEVMLGNAAGRTVEALFTAHFPPHAGRDSTLVVAISEILDRREARNAVARSDYRYRRLFPALAAGYWELDMRTMNDQLATLREQGVDDLVAYSATNPGFVEDALRLITVSDVNDRTAELMGASTKGELIGVPVVKFWPEESKSAFLGALNAGYRGRDWSDRETRLRTLDGREIDVLFSAASPPNMRDLGIAVLSVTDITERREAERRLADSEYRSRKLFEAMALGIWELDFREMKTYVYGLVQQGLLTDLFEYSRANPDFVTTMMSLVRVVEVNQKCLELFGANTQDDIRVDLGTFWPPESHHLFLQAVHHTSVLKHDKFEAETRVRRLDGTVFDALFTSWEMPEITDPNHVLVGIVDISEKVAARKELVRAREEMAHAARVSMLGELAASIAHELNQPLAAISTLGEANRRWLDRDPVDLAKIRDLNGKMVGDAQRAAGIISRIRSMAVPASAEHRPVDVGVVIRDSVGFLEHEVLAKNVTIDMSLVAGVPLVLADAIQLQQVLVNLLVNAIQAMTSANSARKHIAITTSTESDGRIVILIRDTGPGIAADSLPRIFDSFFTTKANGMGIGLPICRTIVEGIGGTIECLEVDQGAAFKIQLPVLES